MKRILPRFLEHLYIQQPQFHLKIRSFLTDYTQAARRRGLMARRRFPVAKIVGSSPIDVGASLSFSFFLVARFGLA